MKQTIQEQLYTAIRELYSDAIPKKINRDNYLDLMIVSVHEKRGSHLFFNTSRKKIKVGFYSRNKEWMNELVDLHPELEHYANGIRPKGNPEFVVVEEAIDIAVKLLGFIKGGNEPTQVKTKQEKAPIKDSLINETTALHTSGVAKTKSGDFQGAIEDFNKIIEMDPDYDLAFFSRAVAKFNLKNYQGVIEDLNKAIKINPNNFSAFNLRANAKQQLEDYQGAIDDFDKSIEMKADTWTILDRGNLKIKIEDYQGAIDDFNKVLEIDPSDDWAIQARGVAKSKLGDYQGAIDDFNKVLEIDPNDAGAFRERGKVKSKLKDYQGAIDDFNKVINELDPNDKEALQECEAAKSKLKDIEGASTKDILTKEIQEESDNRGLAMYRLTSKINSKKYFKMWEVPTNDLAGRVFKAYIPDWVDQLTNEKVCRRFNTAQLKEINKIITEEKLIPILNKYIKIDALLSEIKSLWWLVPFCIWKDEILSWVAVDKNGFYAAHPGDNDVVMIMAWDNVTDIDFDDYTDPNINTMTVQLDVGNGQSGELTFSEFVSNDDKDDLGSYLSVMESIYKVRKPTIEASKGKSNWEEGTGGEWFCPIDKPKSMLNRKYWIKSKSPASLSQLATQNKSTPTKHSPTKEKPEKQPTEEKEFEPTLLHALGFCYLTMANFDGEFSGVEMEKYINLSFSAAIMLDGAEADPKMVKRALAESIVWFKSIPTNEEKTTAFISIIRSFDKQIDESGKKQLIEDLEGMAAADGVIHKNEKILLDTVKKIFKM